MELSKTERLILMNQFQILKYLDADAARHYERASEILRKGYTLLYPEIADILEESELCGEKVQLLKDIIDAYKSLEAYKSSNPDDTEVGHHPWAVFRGFDNTTETEYHNLARLLIGEGLIDSETPTLPKYRMVALTWAGHGKPAEICQGIAWAMLGLGIPNSTKDEGEKEKHEETDTESGSVTDAKTDGSESASKPETASLPEGVTGETPPPPSSSRGGKKRTTGK